MKKGKFLKFGAVLLAACLASGAAVGLAACGGGGGGDIEFDENGNIRPSGSGKTTVNFWGYGDDNEHAVFTNLVAQFNEKYKDANLEVKYEQYSSDELGRKVKSALKSSRAAVDIFYAGDADYKTYATAGYLEPLDVWINGGETESGTTLPASKEIKIEEMWETSVNRYKYDVETTTEDGPNAHYWGIPKDIGPIVIFYNETQFNNAGIKVISVAKEDLAEFNAGTKADARGKTKTEYGITGEVKEKGYFVDGTQKWFNNQIPMSWEETIDVATILKQDNAANNKYSGYYTEWWFNYGWSVGGDCIEYVEDSDPQYTGGYWDLTLFEDTPNYIVADNVQGTVTVGSKAYSAGQLIEWKDKIQDTHAANRVVTQQVKDLATAGTLNELPSQRDAMIEFVALTTPTTTEVAKGKYGHAVSAYPKQIGSDSDKATKFAEGQIGMLVDGRWNVVDFRKQCGEKPGDGAAGGGKFEWDVAPLPQYKKYDAQGNVTVHGVEAGHSGSVALCINKKSTKKNAAWLFAEFIGGRTGQTAQAESGFAIPSQKDLANSEVFLQSGKNPRNSSVFVRAAAYETPGDWWYLRDNAWINAWANDLNHKVREGDMTFLALVNSDSVGNTPNLLKEYTKKS